MNRLRESKGVSNEAKFRLAAAYASIGQTAVAKQILSTARLDETNNKHYYYTYGSSDRNRAMALETYVLLKDQSKAQELAKMIAQNLSDKRYMSTQSTSYSLMAMAKFAAMIGGKGIKTSYTINGKSERIGTEKTLASRPIQIKKGSFRRISLHLWCSKAEMAQF